MSLINPQVQKCTLCKEQNPRTNLESYVVKVGKEHHLVKICKSKCKLTIGDHLDAVLNRYVSQFNPPQPEKEC